MHGDQRIGRMLRERCGKGDLLGGRAARRLKIRSAEMLDQARRQGLDRRSAGFLVRLDDLHQRRPAQARNTQKAAAKELEYLTGFDEFELGELLAERT